ncbi:MAG: ABC transporter permease [Sphaerochaeta sp.]|jgi:peptide/nickel transport system permease protein|nr:ABC transporter permease [Sphaerochaeta sp.]MCI2077014.1 ABC transporter permease [Sphaerochaeta sp.]
MLRKLGWYAITLVLAVILNFVLPRLIKGNPVASIVNSLARGMADTNQMKRMYETYMTQFGLDQPLWKQFFIYVRNLFHGQMGISFSQYPRDVSNIIGSAFGWTLLLQLPAILVAWIIGNILGVLAAYKRGVFDNIVFTVFLFLNAIPAFGLSIIFVWIFANTLHIAPANLAYRFDLLIDWSNPEFIRSVFSHYQLPFWSMVLVAVGGQSLGMREMSIYELNADYVKFSRLLGISDRKIIRYVFHNAMLPQITGLALSLGTMMGGSLIAEIVFSYPGIGTVLYSAIRNQDYPLISGCTLVITLMVLVANFVVDILYGFVDPRIKLAQQEGQ